jgi:hypothetical protein
MPGVMSDIEPGISLQSWQVVTALGRFDYHLVLASRSVNKIHHDYRIVEYPDKKKYIYIIIYIKTHNYDNSSYIYYIIKRIIFLSF